MPGGRGSDLVPTEETVVRRYQEEPSTAGPEVDGLLRNTAQSKFHGCRKGGAFVVGLQSGLAPLRSSDWRLHPLRAVEPDKPGNRLNDGARSGQLWLDPWTMAKEKSGSLYRLDPNGPVEIDSGYAIQTSLFSPTDHTSTHRHARQRSTPRCGRRWQNAIARFRED